MGTSLDSSLKSLGWIRLPRFTTRLEKIWSISDFLLVDCDSWLGTDHSSAFYLGLWLFLPNRQLWLAPGYFSGLCMIPDWWIDLTTSIQSNHLSLPDFWIQNPIQMNFSSSFTSDSQTWEVFSWGTIIAFNEVMDVSKSTFVPKRKSKCFSIQVIIQHISIRGIISFNAGREKLECRFNNFGEGIYSQSLPQSKVFADLGKLSLPLFERSLWRWNQGHDYHKKVILICTSSSRRLHWKMVGAKAGDPLLPLQNINCRTFNQWTRGLQIWTSGTFVMRSWNSINPYFKLGGFTPKPFSTKDSYAAKQKGFSDQKRRFSRWPRKGLDTIANR